MTPAVIILGLVTLQRVGELLLAQRNTERLLAAGAYEVAPEHYGLLVGLHGAWLLALWLWGHGETVEVGWLIVFACLQTARVWVIATLGPRWTTRIIVMPRAPLVATGPYRLLAHPNYAVVTGEIAVLPLAFNLPAVALVFSILNAAILAIRVRSENRALDRATSWLR
jgi:methyltransferase